MLKRASFRSLSASVIFSVPCLLMTSLSLLWHLLFTQCQCHQKRKKGTKALCAVSFVLFLVECLSVLLFAYLIRHFYHYEAYREFYGRVLTEKVHAESFDLLFLYMFAAVVAVISVAIMLLAISNYCCHPKSTLFPIVSPKPASNPAETGDEEDQDEEGQ